MYVLGSNEHIQSLSSVAYSKRGMTPPENTPLFKLGEQTDKSASFASFCAAINDYRGPKIPSLD